jgi:hypothetical protein
MRAPLWLVGKWVAGIACRRVPQQSELIAQPPDAMPRFQPAQTRRAAR